MSDLVHRRLRAPQEEGAALVDPPLESIPQVYESNLGLASGSYGSGNGRWLRELAAGARGELLAKAIEYTGAYRDIGSAKKQSSESGFVLSGHQPELFHPGVWFKNFLLSSIAARIGGVAINLIVDSDTVRSTAIRVPVIRGGQASIESVAFDAPGDAIPFEERPVIDRGVFESFAERAIAAYRTCHPAGGQDVLIEPVWQAAVRILGDGKDGIPLGRIISQARHQVEEQIGLSTLELPLSSVTQTASFRRFAVHLLAELPKLHSIYNGALDEYRVVNRIRSATHPVPALAEEDGWLEAPLLVWTKENPRRRHVFVCRQGNSLVVSDRQDVRFSLSISLSGGVEKAVEELAAVEGRGIKLRPRALITTMYARLALSDLFIHGIGGAKYDELTDLIVGRFFGIEPPAYVTATATFRLPIERPMVTADDLLANGRRIRDVRYHPESLLREPLVAGDTKLREALEALAAQKRDYLARHELRRCAPDVFAGLDQLNRAMYAVLQPVEQQLRDKQAVLMERYKQSQLLGSREFSFVLFPAEKLPARLLDLAKLSS